MMKRAHHNHGFVIEEANKPNFHHQILLKEFLELQKGFVSKKRKLQNAKQKREILSAEVRFLKRRHEYLSRNHSSDTDQEEARVHRRNSDTVERSMEPEGNSSDATQVAFNDTSLPSISNPDMRNEESDPVTFTEEERRNMLEICLNGDERLSKEKMPCYNQSESNGLNLNMLCS